MKLKQIVIEKLPGFGPGELSLLKSELSSEINVILGPNGSGKSSLCLAMQKCLWPKQDAQSASIFLHSLWEEKQSTWEIELQQDRYIRHNLSGDQTELFLPPAHLAPCFVLRIDDLFESEDRSFSSKVLRAFHGGVDFTLLLNHFGDPLSRQFGKNESRRYLKKQQELLSSKGRHKALFEREKGIKGLERKIVEAKDAEKKLSIIEEQILLRRHQEELKALDTRMALIPEYIAGLQGNESSQFDELSEQIAHLENERLSLEEKSTHLQSKLEQIPLYKQREITDQIKKCKSILNQWEVLNDEIKHINDEQHQLQTRFQRQLQFVGCSPDFFDRLNLRGINQLYEFYKAWRSSESKEQELLARLAATEVTSHDDLELLTQGKKLLRALEHFKLGCIYLVPLSAFTALSIYLLSQQVHFKDLWPLFLGLGCAVLSMASNAVRVVFCKRGCKNLNLEEIEKRIQQELYQKVIKEQHQELAQRLERLNLEQAELREKICTLLPQQLEELSQPEERLDLLLESLEEGERTYLRLKECDALCSIKKLEALEISQAISKYLQREVISTYEAKTIIDDLNEQTHQITIAEQELQLVGREKIQASKHCSLAIEKRTELLMKCHLTCDRVHNELPNLLEQHKEWLLLKNQRAAIVSKIELLESKVESSPLSVQELLERKDVLVKLVGEQEELYGSLRNLEIEIAKAGQRGDFTEARRGVEETEGALKEKRKSALKVYIAKTLLEGVKKRIEKNQEPELFRLADQWFQRFTSQAYRLLMPEQPNAPFRAFDIKKEQSRKLEELSRGTRLQLLIAVRLAFCLSEEKEEPLPLFCDEIFAHFDKERMEAAIMSLVEIAKSGRQIFYFTCRESEWHIWQRIANQQQVNVHEIVLKKQEISQEKIGPQVIEDLNFPDDLKITLQHLLRESSYCLESFWKSIDQQDKIKGLGAKRLKVLKETLQE